MQALVEVQTTAPSVVESDGNATYVSGIASVVEHKNRNGRVYPRAVMERAIEDARQKISEGAFLGELDHPENGAYGSLDRTAVRFTDLFFEGDVVKFRGVILETKAGRNLKALLQGGVKVGMSTRGAGTLIKEKRNGEDVLVVGPDYQLFGIDAVNVPSSEKGVMSLQESLEEKLNQTLKGQETMPLTLDELKEQHKDLYEQFRNKVLSEVHAEMDALRKKLSESEQKVQQLESIKREVLGDENKPATAIVATLESLQTQLAEMKAALDESQQALQAEKERAARQKELTELYEKTVSGHRYETNLRKYVQLEEGVTPEKLLEDIEFFTRMFDDLKVVSVPTNEKSAGKGIVENQNTEEEKPRLDETELSAMRLLGNPITEAK